ncbi:hypothetical protein IQ07DRAFT_587520 [Pyrenochaeta sp. DS3sAY3a]|nr:hypothetical protein IQ07DRAFT_587520 [Pyrenochaeta sp. DS3sAY3a]
MLTVSPVSRFFSTPSEAKDSQKNPGHSRRHNPRPPLSHCPAYPQRTRNPKSRTRNGRKRARNKKKHTKASGQTNPTVPH